MPNSKGFSQPSDSNAAIFQTSKAAFFHVFSLRSPPGPGDDIQLASALGPPEQPRAVSTAYGNVEPTDAAELTSASTSNPDSCEEAAGLVSGDVPVAAAPGGGVELPPQEAESVAEEIKR
ncbi:hypothetical protein CIB84_012355 [Bambusicola thoracicus]|uniref:Uncharacterized protein n=1 Tax=Bambusicola thoracicus TaxID=9083 RepID=A0A2P4SIG4_BAMTH|nr:hypothetical protein CIB84_012355 [Bambusicola thoracicus]